MNCTTIQRRWRKCDDLVMCDHGKQKIRKERYVCAAKRLKQAVAGHGSPGWTVPSGQAAAANVSQLETRRQDGVHSFIGCELDGSAIIM